MVKYEASSNATIQAVDIKRETAHFVFFPDGRRNAQSSEYNSFHDTKEQAKQWLVDKAQKKVDELKGRLDYAKARLGNAKGIKVD